MNENEQSAAGANTPDRPVLDPELVARVVGKRLLIGVTYLTHNGKLIEQKQLHGVVEEISYAAGTYRLRSTGEEVEDPDFLYTWTITRPKPDAG